MTPDPHDAGAPPLVHPSAIIEEGVELGDATRVWHHSHVRRSARLGAGTSLGKNVFVDSGVEVGARVKVQNNVSIFRGVAIADDVFVGPSVVFTNDRVPRATSNDWTVQPTQVEQGASLGANATLVAPVRIGRWSAVAAGAVVIRDVEPHEMVAGNPAKRIGWICRCGETRVPRDADRLSCPACKTELDLR